MFKNSSRFCAIFIALWVVQVIWTLWPQGATLERVIAEWTFWAMFCVTSLQTFTFEDDRDLNYNYLHSFGPSEDHVANDSPLRYVTYTRDNFTIEQAKIDTNNFDIPFIVKGFAHDLLSKFEFDYIIDTFDPDFKYDFEMGNVAAHNFSSGVKPKFKHKELTIQDGLKEMKETENLYLRFSQTLHQQNPEFGNALTDSIKRVGPGFAEHVGNLDTANRLCFIGMGEKSKTIQHGAVTDNWFLQVAGKKRWVITPPEYTPYWKPVFTPTIAVGSLLPLADPETKVPVLEITSEPGDLFYFPGFWWHEVNNEGSLNFGCGIRPRESVLRVFKSLAFPALAFPSGSLGIYLGIWPQSLNVLRKNMDFKFTTDWKNMFSPKRHQKWWTNEKKDL